MATEAGVITTSTTILYHRFLGMDLTLLRGKLLLIYICIFHVLSHLLLNYICKLHWNLNSEVDWRSNISKQMDSVDAFKPTLQGYKTHKELTRIFNNGFKPLRHITNVIVRQRLYNFKNKLSDAGFEGKLLLIYICNFHVLSHLLLIYICKLHWNFQCWLCSSFVYSATLPCWCSYGKSTGQRNDRARYSWLRYSSKRGEEVRW